MENRRGARRFRWILLLMVSVTVFAAAIYHIKELNHDNIHNGVLDLSSWDYGDIVVLNGEAEFYWDKFLTEKDFEGDISPDSMPSVPSVWNYYELNGGKKPSGKGYATYRIHVAGVKPGKALAMRVQPLSTAYELYIDAKLMASCGRVGTTEGGAYPQYAIRTFEFTPDSDYFDVVIHASNFTYARGGLWYPIDLGTPEQIGRLNMIIFACDVFTIGLFLLLLIYNIFYCILRRDKYLILFMVMCLLLICRTMILGSYIVNFIFPAVNFNIYIWLNYIPVCFLPSVCLVLVYHYFSVNISKRVVWLSLGFSSAAAAAALTLPTYIFTQFTYLIFLCVLFICLYVIWKLVSTLASDKVRHMDILFMFLGIIAVTLCTVRDIMFNENLIKTGRMDSFSMGFMLLTLLWDMSITYRYEALIKDRLRVLQELNISSDRERALELKFLKSQIRPHFINNALNTVISVSRTDIDRARLLLVQFSKYLRGRYDFEHLDDVIPLEQELEYVRSYLAIEEARFGDGLQIEYDIDDVVVLVPPLLLQPLVENAVIHGVRSNPGGGRIRIYVKDETAYIKIGVTDNGAGMDRGKIKDMLGGTSEKNGVALYNINERLSKLYHTELSIISPEGGGLDVSALIPKKGGEVK